MFPDWFPDTNIAPLDMLSTFDQRVVDGPSCGPGRFVAMHWRLDWLVAQNRVQGVVCTAAIFYRDHTSDSLRGACDALRPVDSFIKSCKEIYQKYDRDTQ